MKSKMMRGRRIRARRLASIHEWTEPGRSMLGGVAVAITFAVDESLMGSDMFVFTYLFWVFVVAPTNNHFFFIDVNYFIYSLAK
jgi:hypothetical protein